MRRWFLRGWGGGQGLPHPPAEGQCFLRVSAHPGRCFRRVPPGPPGHNNTFSGPPVTEGLPFSQIIVLTPIFLPIITPLGIDPIHFGVLFVVTAEIGFLTPPFGANLFVGMKIANLTLEELSIAVLPFIVAYAVVLLILVFFPEISLFLPRLVFG